MSPSESASAHERKAFWNRAMCASPGELDVEVVASQVRGVVPEALRGGTLYSNGPGWTRIGDRTAHPFDGHGYVRRIYLRADGSVQLRARFVETPSFVAERKAGRLLHRGLATNVSDLPWQNWRGGPVRNVANTTIVRWGDRLLAGWEAGCPYAVDPLTLDTLREERFGDVLDGTATLAHMRFDAAADRLTLCGLQMGRNTTLTFRELNRADEVVHTTKTELPGMLFLHDYAFTPSCFVVGGNPLRLKPGALLKFAAGLGVFFGAVTPNIKAAGVLHLIARNGSGVRTVQLPAPAFVIHFGNAFERADGTVVVDMCAFESFDFGAEFGYQGPHGEFDPALPEARVPQALYRVTIPPGATSASWERLTDHGVDFPRFHPEHEGQETPVMFGATRADTRYSDPFDSILRIDLSGSNAPQQLWTAPDGAFVGEPLFAPAASDPSQGHVLVLTTDGRSEQTSLEIFDATNLEAGPVASVPLPLLPVAFHGEWVAPE